MADNQYGEARQYDFDTGGGTDLAEVSGLIVAASGGGVIIGGFDLAGQNGLAVAIVDGSGNQITSFGGGTQYVEDAALGAVGSATGTLHMARAAATVPGSVSADADAVALWALRNGILNVRMVDSSGAALSIGGGTQYTEDAALGAVGSAIGTMAVGRASAAAPTSVSADADAVGLWASRFGALNVILRDTAGAAVATGTQYTEDTAISANAGVGTLLIARRDDALSTLTPAADDAVGLRVGDKGALWVQISDGSGNQITSFGAPSQPTTGTESNVASAATDTTILASNASRKAATVTNDSTQILYLLLSNATSSSTVYTVKLASGAYYELPSPVYTGVIKGIWAAANGYARVTELT